MTAAEIPFESLDKVNRPFEPLFREAFERVVRSGWYVLGREVTAFEREFSGAFGLPHGVGVASGYDALVLSFMAAGITSGEVLVPANTYMASILAVLRAGLTPVLVDPDPATMLLSAERAERAISADTVAILPVHLYGLACGMEDIAALAARRGLAIVEDCAQAVGAACGGSFVGSFSAAAAFSFYPTKNLGCLGDGGLLSTARAEVAERARMLRNYGSKTRAVADEVGLNSRLDELQAAFLRAKLGHLGEINARKNALAARYDAGLDESFTRPVVVPGTSPARCLYVVRHPRRDELREYLAGRGIATDIHYPVPPHRQKAIEPFARGDFPVATRLASEILSLPLSYGHTEDQIDRVIAAANDFTALHKK